MPAELFEKLRAAFESIQKMKIADASGTSVGHAVFDRENDCRSIELLGQPRCCQADHALVPSITRDNDEALAIEIFASEQRKFGNLLLHLLTLTISAVESIRVPTGHHEIIGFKKFNH